MVKRRVKRTKRTNLKNYWFRTDKRSYVVAQWPNRALWMALVSFLVIIFTPRNGLQIAAQAGFVSGLGYWSWGEVRDGVNRFRRALGGATMLIVLLVGFAFVSGVIAQLLR